MVVHKTKQNGRKGEDKSQIGQKEKGSRSPGQELRGGRLLFVVSGGRGLGYLRRSLLSLRTRSILAIIPGGIAWVHLVSQILIFHLVEQFLLVLVWDDLGAIPQ